VQPHGSHDLASLSLSCSDVDGGSRYLSTGLRKKRQPRMYKVGVLCWCYVSVSSSVDRSLRLNCKETQFRVVPSQAFATSSMHLCSPKTGEKNAIPITWPIPHQFRTATTRSSSLSARNFSCAISSVIDPSNREVVTQVSGEEPTLFLVFMIYLLRVIWV
jgi:hypothetical protein